MTIPSIESPPPVATDSRVFQGRACGLLFAVGELIPGNAEVSHFVQAQGYSQPNVHTTNAAGTVTTRHADGRPEEQVPYETLTELVHHLGLTQNGTNLLLKRLRATLSS